MKEVKHILFYAIKGLAVTVLAFCVMVYFNLAPVRALSVLLVILQFLLILEYRKFKPFAFFLIFILPYTLVAYWHFANPEFPLSLVEDLDFDKEVYHTGVFIILSVFWAVFVLLLPKIHRPVVLRNYINCDNRPMVFYFILIAQILILIFGRTGGTIFEAGGYATEASTTKNLGGTAIFEYFLVLYPIAFYFSGRNRIRILLLIAIAALYCLKAILLGGRIEMLQCLILVFILHFDNARTSLFKLILLALPFVVFFIAFGFFRSAPDLSFHELYNLVTENLKVAGYSFFGNQIDVYYSSSRLYGFCTDGILSISERLSIFLYNILAVVVPYSWLPPQANLAAYRQADYFSGGGGFIPIYFFVYLSYIGVLFLSIFIGTILRRIIKYPDRASIYLQIYVVMVLATYPRWYAYSANVIYKFCVYSVLLLLIIRVLVRLTNRSGAISKIEKPLMPSE